MNKRRKRRNRQRKPRKRIVEVDFGVPVKVDAVAMRSDGSIVFIRNGAPIHPKTAVTRVEYERTQKPKIVAAAPLSDLELQSHPENTISHYDRILVIDTNTRVIRGTPTHVAVTILAETRTVGGEKQLAYAPGPAFEFRGPITKPERFAWRELISRLKRPFDSKLRIALVVDSELGQHAAINERTAPVYEDYYLPSGFSVLYASAETGQELILNRFMSDCNAAASSLLDIIEGSNDDPPSERSLFCDAPFRPWYYHTPPSGITSG